MFDQLVKVHAEQLEGKTKMLFVDEGIFQSKQVVVIAFIVLAIELCNLDISIEVQNIERE